MKGGSSAAQQLGNGKKQRQNYQSCSGLLSCRAAELLKRRSKWNMK